MLLDKLARETSSLAVPDRAMSKMLAGRRRPVGHWTQGCQSCWLRLAVAQEIHELQKRSRGMLRDLAVRILELGGDWPKS